MKQDFQLAALWYRRAAEQGWALAQINLARLLENGEGVAENKPEAFYWYRLATAAREDDLRREA